MDDKLELFKKMVNDHDLTFIYSDSGGAWKRGQQELDAIKAMAKGLPHDQVVSIWNSMVDRRMAPGFREQFYWKWK